MEIPQLIRCGISTIMEPAPGDARTTRTKRARQDPASGVGVLSNPVGARETAPRGAGVPSYAGAPLVSVQPLSGWA